MFIRYKKQLEIKPKREVGEKICRLRQGENSVEKKKYRKKKGRTKGDFGGLEDNKDNLK